MIKKILILLLISSLFGTYFVGCKKAESIKATSTTNTSSAKTSASPTNTTSKSTPAATSTSSAVTAYPAINAGSITEYSIELDFQIKTRVAGIVFGGIDEASFLMWQVNSWTYGDDPAIELPESERKVYLRPHIWSDGAITVIDELDISNAIKWEDRAKTQHMKITVSATNEVNTFINNVLVYTYTDPMAAYGLFGFRETTVVAAYFDNIVIKNTASNTIIFQDDFNKKINPFSEGEIVSGVMGDSPALSMTGLTGGAGEICVLE